MRGRYRVKRSHEGWFRAAATDPVGTQQRCEVRVERVQIETRVRTVGFVVDARVGRRVVHYNAAADPVLFSGALREGVEHLFLELRRRDIQY